MPNHRGQRVWVICDWCGKKFSLNTSEYHKRLKNKSKRMFCRDTCYDAYKAASKKIKAIGLEAVKSELASVNG